MRPSTDLTTPSFPAARSESWPRAAANPNRPPRNPSLKRLLKTFDIHMNANLKVRKTEMVQPNGDHIVTTYTNESRVPTPAATFEFTPPPEECHDALRALICPGLATLAGG